MCKSVINAISFAGGGGGSVNTGVLQIAGGVAIDGTLRAVEDQNGNDSVLSLSNAAATFGNGTITAAGLVTIKGDGGAILNLRNSANVQRLTIDNDGNLTISDGFFANYGVFASGSTGVKIGSGLRIKNPADGVMLLQNDAANNFDKIAFGSVTDTDIAIIRNLLNFHFKTAAGNNFCGITAGRSTEKTIEVTEVSGAMGLGFFDTPAINQPTTAIAEAAFVSGGAGTNVKTDDTFGGYTLQQIAQALQNLGLIA